jgi:hypothetical protein
MLTMNDARAIVNSDQVTGMACLYDPDDVNLESWITVTIPRELRLQLNEQSTLM